MKTQKNPDYLVLINSENKMPEGYEDSVDYIKAENCFGEKFLIERKTLEAFLKLKEDLLKNDNIQAELISVYRSVPEQVETFERYVRSFGEEYANKYAAKPGHSEHHTGLAIDVGIVLGGKLYRTIEEMISIDEMYLTVQSKLSSYGFILRYPKEKEHITGIGYEPWHFRYIDSPELAKEITDKGICLEEYFEK